MTVLARNTALSPTRLAKDGHGKANDEEGDEDGRHDREERHGDRGGRGPPGDRQVTIEDADAGAHLPSTSAKAFLAIAIALLAVGQPA